MKKILSIFLLCVLLPTGFMWWASLQPLVVGKRNDQSYQVNYDFKPIQESKSLRIMTWNMAFLHGEGSEGSGYQKHSLEFYQNKLKSAAELIKKHKVDILLLQEIDWASSRTYFVNQVAELASATELNYYAPAISWANNYVPFPYWPPTVQFGVMNSGGAIISRFPIAQNVIQIFEHPKKNPWWYNLFYLYRYSQAVQIKLSKKAFWVLNHHLEAFDKDSRQLQATQIIQQVSQYHPILALGGDFNAIPQESFLNKHYAGDSVDIYRPDSTLDIIRSTTPLKDSISTEEYLLNEKFYYTFPAHLPDRRLDYLFIDQKTKINSAQVISAGTISDHLPYMIEIEL